MDRQLALAKAALATGRCGLGSCWGLQIVSAAAGGVIAKSDGTRFGIARQIALTEQGRAHPMFAGRADRFDAPFYHIDLVAEPPEGAVILASNARAPIQALALERDGFVFWGLQYHPEFDLGVVAALARLRAALLIEEGVFADCAAVTDYAAKAEAGDADLGLDDEILDFERRTGEIRRWLDLCRSRLR